MRTVIAALLLLGASGVAAHAETFTFTSTATTTNQVIASVPGGGDPVAAAFLSGSSHAIYASGKATTNTFSCAQWTATPGELFKTYTACTYSEPGGDTASIVAGCNYANKDQTEADCVAGLNGLSGPHQGKTGTMTWHAKLSADRKAGTSAGVGQWND